MANMHNVYVVDDDDTVRQSLQFLLKSARYDPDLYESAVQFLASAADLAPGCVITDVRMPEMDGLELVQRLSSMGLAHQVVVMTGHADVQMAVAAMKAGAVDFLEKPFEDELLLAAVQAALEAEERLTQSRATQARLAELLSDLTPREQQVLDGVVAGKMNKIIAYELGISERTVEVYRANIMQKTGANSLSELVRMALLSGR
ncbi:MAG: response regulator FixJ [Caulobacteraceae bacterium]